MRSPLLSFLFSLLLLVSIGSAANIRRVPQRQPAPDKAYYNLFPTPGTDYDETAAFIKATVGVDDLLPWTDVNENLKSWTVQANSVELAQLQTYGGIERIAKVELPIATSPSTSSISGAAQDDGLSKRQDAVQEWLVFPTDTGNKPLVDETRQFLKTLTNEDPEDHFHHGLLDFWVSSMTLSQRDEALRNSGIAAIEENEELTEDRVAPPQPSPVALLSGSKAKRDVNYLTQSDAVTELVAVSQPSTVPNINELKNYVFEGHNGDKSFVYHIEAGVSFVKQAAEFPNLAADHLLTPKAKQQNLRPEDDASLNPSHATCTAGKALGQQYGVAKKATLVVVKLASRILGELFDAIELVLEDIKARPERQKRSVVTISLSGPIFKPGSTAHQRVKNRFKELLDADVPVVISAGNMAQTSGRELVDTVPAVFAAPDYPLIIVGSTTPDGTESVFSQRGPHVTIHAVGEGITCMPKDGNAPIINLKGTSFAAPMVAGEIANLLSYDTVPFDTSDGNLAKSVRDHFLTDPTAGWARQPGIRMVWNKVAEADNPRQPPPPPVEKNECAGLGSSKYVGREVLRDVIENRFCPEAVAQGVLDKDSASILRRYNEGTMDDVVVSIDFRPGLDFRPNQADCVRRLLGDVTDGCDGNDPVGNPENYKGGGRLTAGEVAYRVEPQTLRQPADKGKQGGCDSTYKFLWNEYVMWGHGFASDDSGAALKGQVDDCALLPDTWDFQYGLGSDGREWTAKFRTGVFQRGCVGQAAKEAGAPGDFGCGGSG